MNAVMRSTAMNEDLLQFGLKAFVTMFVVVDPVGVAPMFVALTRGSNTVERRTTLLRAIVIAFAVTLFFLLADDMSCSIWESRCTPSRSAVGFCSL